MARRLNEKYPLGQSVEIWFEQISHWVPGVVIRHQHPAVWVRTVDGRDWFVTNGSRIRELLPEPTPDS